MVDSNSAIAPNNGQEEWWVQGWLDLLNSYRFKKRLERARIYARQGNVLSIEFRGAKVLAKVQGTEVEPYKLSLSLEPFDDEAWEGIIETMAERAEYAAKLLAGEMPASIDEVFTANGLSLFPFNLTEVRSKCSCPDKANPCKHIGAVYYLLGDRFREDPFVLFQLRGRTQAQIVAALREVRARQLEEMKPQTVDGVEVAEATESDAIALMQQQEPVNLEQFWNYDEPLDPDLVVITPPPDANTPLDLLGPIPLPTDVAGSADDGQLANKAIMKYLEEGYQTAAQQAMMKALGS
ncbi:MAG: SWIM zinc finger family protein [Cyanobacteria bacterium P01_D01_bin.73]